jgi:hypothetical protein
VIRSVRRTASARTFTYLVPAIPSPEDTVEHECTHEIIEMGRCAGCGKSIDYDDDEGWSLPRPHIGHGPHGDGSAQEAAARGESW